MRVFAGLLLVAASACASTPGFWEMSSFADFVKGKFEGVSLGRDGRLTAAPTVDMLFDSGQPAIWATAQAPDGSLYVATGHRGRVYRVDKAGKSSLVWTADKPEVFALAVDSKGVLYAGTSPDGQIVRVENGKGTVYFDPKATYIWALAVGPDGALYAGTGADGKVFRIVGAGQGEEYYSTGQVNVTSLLFDPQGRLLAGTEPNGVLYRITGKDKAFALYDSTLPEIRAIALGDRGEVYAAGLGGALVHKIQGAQQSGGAGAQDAGAAVTSITVTADAGGDLKPTAPEAPKTGAAAVQPAQAVAQVAELANVEKSAIYRINVDNTVDTLWSSKEENVFDILPTDAGGLLFGTDKNGRVYRLTADHRLTLVVELKDAEAVRLIRWSGSTVVATANMGRLRRMGATVGSGTYESQVFDAGTAARWGRFRWTGSGAVLMTRSGNSLRPDSSWSDWSAALSDAAGTQIASPNARFLQFKASLTGTGYIDNVSAAYLPQNNPPAVRSITVLSQQVAAPSGKTSGSGAAASGAATFSVSVTDTGDAGPSPSTGTATQTVSRAAVQQVLVAWTADDPDSDKLVYQLDYRGEGEREWKNLRRNLHDTNWTLDADVLPDGRYWFRVVASDRESNAGVSAKEAELVSSPVLIDNTPPVVRVVSSKRTGAGSQAFAEIAFEAKDAASPLRRAEWSVDAGPWTAIAPTDGILDSPEESFALRVVDLGAGEHVVALRVSDSGGNTAVAKVILP